MKLRVGLVGLGNQWERRHRPALWALTDRFEVRAVCGEVGHLASQAAHEFGAAPVDGFRALAARQDVDAILMLAPQWFGPLPILAACDFGRAIYCANVLDLQAEQSREIRARVEKAGIAFMLELPRRYAPATLRLKELIATRLGMPQMVFCHQRLANRVASRGRPKPVNDEMLQNIFEMVDWCRYVINREPTSVVGLAHLLRDGTCTKDYEMMSLDFSVPGQSGMGPIAQISCGRYISDGWPEAVAFRPPAALQVRCENGIAFVDFPTTLTWFDEAGRHQESLENERPVGERLLSQFYRDVTSLVRNPTNLKDTFRAQAIVAAARLSAGEGRRVDV